MEGDQKIPVRVRATDGMRGDVNQIASMGLLPQAVATRPGGDVAIVTRHLPLTSIHPNAFSAAIAAEAAGRQGKFDEMADLLFSRRLSTGWDRAGNPIPFFQSFAEELGLDIRQFNDDFQDEALEDRVRRDRDDAISRLGFTGTPSFALNDQAISPPGLTQSQVNLVLQNAVDDVDFPFAIDRFTGDITVRDGTLLDFEDTATYEFDVMVNGALQTITIDIGNVAGV